MDENLKQSQEIKEKFSYSKLGCFEQCPFKYKLIYKDNHFISSQEVATDFGTLVHFIEESMANILLSTYKLNQDDYDKLVDTFYNICDDKEKIYGVNILKERYKDVWYKSDKNGKSYDDKVLFYLQHGIYNLKNILIRNPNLEIVGAEIPFKITINNHLFTGFIDRVFRDVNTNIYYIEDIKTWSSPAKEEDLKTPLQFVIYVEAVKELYNVPEEQIQCAYNLPLCGVSQVGGTKGYVKRGLTKIGKLLAKIEQGDFAPKPSPLCHWCVFSETKPNQPEEAKKLCPYFSLYTPENKTNITKYQWLGIAQHQDILNAFINEDNKATTFTSEQKEKISEYLSAKLNRIAIYREG